MISHTKLKARLETLLKRCSDRDYLDRVKMKLRKLAKRKVPD